MATDTHPAAGRGAPPSGVPALRASAGGGSAAAALTGPATGPVPGADRETREKHVNGANGAGAAGSASQSGTTGAGIAAATSPSGISAGATKMAVRCPECGVTLRMLPALRGRKVRCPKCGAGFRAGDTKPEAAKTDAPSPSPKAKTDPLLGTRIKHFTLRSVLGRGAMGTVYEAEDVVLKRRVAIKVLLPQVAAEGKLALERFLSEARSAAALQHPNIVYIHQVGCEGNTAFIAMELVPGGSAADFIEEHGAMAARDATRVIVDTARALGEAHAKGVIHRDVKPDNVMLGPNWMIKVTDFGLAKHLENDAELGVKGKALGTPGFMSPETCKGLDTDARSDIYSLGATYYCLLTGKPPFRGGDVRQLLRRHLTEECPDPRTERPDVPAGCVAVLRKAMALDPDKRYQTAVEMIAAMERIDFSATPDNPAQSEEMQSWAELAAAAQQAMFNADQTREEFEGLPQNAVLAPGHAPGMIPGQGSGGSWGLPQQGQWGAPPPGQHGGLAAPSPPGWAGSSRTGLGAAPLAQPGRISSAGGSSAVRPAPSGIPLSGRNHILVPPGHRPGGGLIGPGGSGAGATGAVMIGTIPGTNQTFTARPIPKGSQKGPPWIWIAVGAVVLLVALLLIIRPFRGEDPPKPKPKKDVEWRPGSGGRMTGEPFGDFPGAETPRPKPGTGGSSGPKYE